MKPANVMLWNYDVVMKYLIIERGHIRSSCCCEQITGKKIKRGKMLAYGFRGRRPWSLGPGTCGQEAEKRRYRKVLGWDTAPKDTPWVTCFLPRPDCLLFPIPNNACILWIIKRLGQSPCALPTSADTNTDTGCFPSPQTKQASNGLRRLTITGE